MSQQSIDRLEMLRGEEIDLRRSPYEKKGLIEWAVLNAREQSVGRCSLKKVVTPGVRILSIEIYPRHRNQGLATLVLRRLLRIGFTVERAHRIELCVLETNLTARHIYEKLGFVCEGIRRNMVLEKGQWVGSCIYGLLNKEWEIS